jgi:DUF4097 and DUF4098 domain-containing protein YvlB
MPVFDTPGPIAATIELVVGHVRITAGDRTDTTVEVRPSDESSGTDLKAVKQTRIEYSSGKLLVKTPKLSGLFGKAGSVEVTIELPADSQVRGGGSVADLHAEGRLGECTFKTAVGHIQLGQTGKLQVSTGGGDITVDRAVGHTEVSTGTGTVRVREIDGTAVVKNSNGDSWLGEVTGDLRVSAANGRISVDKAGATVGAKTANGGIRVGEIARGSVVLETSLGELEIGIREGTAARLDLSSTFGSVRNSLTASDGPAPSDETVEVRARTSYGDILIRRA